MADKLNPDDYIITRKRKKYKFALFANSPLCYELDEWQDLQDRGADVIEIGAGTGLFSVELATRHPDKTYIALDVKADRLQKGAHEAEERGLTNIKFVRARADQLADIADAGSVDQIWLTFSDPFPKSRSAGRRMTHVNYLRIYRNILRPSGQLIIKHDNIDFMHWSMEQLVTDKWAIDELTFDLHDSDLSDDYKIITTYEQRWINEGSKIGFVAALPFTLKD